MENSGVINLQGSSNGSISLSTINLNSTGTSTTSSLAWSMYGEKRLVRVDVKNTTIEIIYRQSSNIAYAIAGYLNSSPPDRVWKEIYGLKDGKMSLLQTVEGKHIQARHIPESIEFDE